MSLSPPPPSNFPLYISRIESVVRYNILEEDVEVLVPELTQLFLNEGYLLSIFYLLLLSDMTRFKFISGRRIARFQV